MLTKLYLRTIDPNTTWSKFFSLDIQFLILFSLIIHTILYTIFCNMVSFIFYGKILDKIINKRLMSCLFIFMFFGYIGRFIHVKQTFIDYNYDYEKTKDYLNAHYNSWIFLG